MGFWVGFQTKVSEVPPKIAPFVHLYRFAEAVSYYVLSRDAFYEHFRHNPGSGFILPSCHVGFALELGGQYLVVLDQPYHLKSVERIESEQDLWLRSVRQAIVEP
ncbi:MAG: hypothetical protein P8Q36_03830 [Alphaproteobacteria bacterium]|nr:hypothetical protein [Rhodospirillaceae bacterium]MBT6203818.1 hypothetical protein [Rhodospirillaceae bacterium]MBT6509749.1 hypothetical protein [Rhodospirillaceae bacterium]MBT7612914.1 hypothetical protein [Rhodospirillaceae bacterium]MDG2479985.1 hypothetical protein [Alphaproteobacteria bacterium]